MRVFLLLVFISAVHLSPNPFRIFGTKGKDAAFEYGDYTEVHHDWLLYRIAEDGDRLLLNCSLPDRPQPDSYNITCPDLDSGSGFKLNNLDMSHSGNYREEWRVRGQSTPVGSTVYHFTVCAEGNVDRSAEESDRVYVRDGSAVICEYDSDLGSGSSLQLYEVDNDRSWTLVLDTSSSLEPLVPFQRARLQVHPNSSVTLSETMWKKWARAKPHFCTMWRGGQCQWAKWQMVIPALQVIATHEKESVTLPCRVKQEDIYWSTPSGDVRISSNPQTRPQEVMYMLNDSQSGAYSLNIPSVSRQHAGMYKCENSDFVMDLMFLSVCVESPPVNVMFSRGESVRMDAYVKDWFKNWFRVQWFRQKGLQPQTLFIEYIVKSRDYFLDGNDVRMPEDLRGRVTELNSSTSLNISNLTAENSGVYSWRVIEHDYRPYRPFACHEGSISLVEKA